MLDKIKAQGFKYSTRGAITIAVSDAVIPPQKKQLLADADAQIEKINRQFKRGLVSNDERKKLVIKVWGRDNQGGL